MKNSKFGLKNFRVFDDKGAEFEIAPITVITGGNSSGKSSVFKSLMLLNDFFTTIKSDYKKNEKFELQDYNLIFNKGKHKLGNYEHTLSSFSSSNSVMSFSWTTYSHLLLKEIEIYYNFIADENDFFKNPKILDIKILHQNEEIVHLDFANDFDFKIKYDFFKKHFFQFSQVVKHYNSINHEVQEAFLSGETQIISSPFKSEEELYNTKGVIKKAVESYLYYKNTIEEKIFFKDLTQDCEKVDENAIKYKSLLYLPVVDFFENIEKDKVIEIFSEKFLEDEKINKNYKERLQDLIDLLEEYVNSPYNSFFEYFFNEIQNKLVKGFSTLLVNSNEKYDKNKLIYFHKWLIDYSSTKGKFEDVRDFFKWTKEGACNSFIHEIYEYLIMDNHSQERLFDFVRLEYMYDELPIEYQLYMNYAYLSLIMFPEFHKERYGEEDLRPIANNPARYIIPLEHETAVKFVVAFLQDTIFNTNDYISNIEFIEAVRVTISRIYSFDKSNDFYELLLNYLKSTSKEQTKKEKITPSFNFKYDEKDGIPEFHIVKELVTDKATDNYKNQYPIGDFMKKWLKIFEIADDVIFEDTSDSLGVLIYLQKGKNKELLADQGYGISQLLAIMLKIELSIIRNQYPFSNPLVTVAEKMINKSSVITIEEPEVNLHPKFQSKLAEMFVDAYKNYNVRFMLETHSEYLVRKLQTLVAKKEIQSTDVSIQYIYPHDKKKRPKNTPQVLKINILEDGRLDKPFGVGFFDEADNLALDLLTFKTLN